MLKSPLGHGMDTNFLRRCIAWYYDKVSWRPAREQPRGNTICSLNLTKTHYDPYIVQNYDMVLYKGYLHIVLFVKR